MAVDLQLKSPSSADLPLPFISGSVQSEWHRRRAPSIHRLVYRPVLCVQSVPTFGGTISTTFMFFTGSAAKLSWPLTVQRERMTAFDRLDRSESATHDDPIAAGEVFWVVATRQKFSFRQLTTLRSRLSSSALTRPADVPT